MKKLFFFVVLFSLLWGTASAYQGTLPEIYVTEVKTDKTIYNPGDTVKGTFLIKNYDSVVAPVIYYELILVGDFKDSIPQKQYSHSNMLGPITLAGKGSQTISFEYKIPATLSGEGFGIEVQSMLENGIGMGWGDAFFDITGTSKFITVEKAEITTSASLTRAYYLQEGPMVYEGEKAYLNFELNNQSSASQDVHPKLTIFDRSEARGTLSAVDEPVINAKANTVTKSKIELPTFDYVPRVYVGKLEFTNSAGQQVSNTLDFRYIVFGQMVTINNVIADREYAEAGEVVNLSVDITGAPFDVNTEQIATSTGKVEIKLLNEKDKVVGGALDSEVDFNESRILTYPIEVRERAKELKAEVKAFGSDGSLLGEMTVDLTKNPMPETNLVSDFLQAKTGTYVVFAVILLLVLFAIWGLAVKKNKLAVILLLIAIIPGGAWWLVNRTEEAEAFVVTSYDFDDRREFDNGDPVTFFINYPAPDQVFTPSAVVTVTASAHFRNCGNEPDSDTSFTIWREDDKPGTKITKTKNVEGSSHKNFNFSFPSFELASTTGPQKLMAKYYIEYHGGSGYGYQPYIVEVPPVTPATSTLSVTRSGTGTGIVTGTGISCGSDCEEVVDYGSTVNLGASPASGSNFSGWSISCGGTGECNVIMNADKIVNAIFTLAGGGGCTGAIPTSFEACSGTDTTSGAWGYTSTCPGSGQCQYTDHTPTTSVNGECIDPGPYPSGPPYFCEDGTLSGFSGPAGGPWYWSCLGINGGTDDLNCSASMSSVDSTPELECKFDVAPETVDINSQGTWVISSKNNVDYTGYIKSWDIDGPVGGNDLTLEVYLTTLGEKEIFAKVASSTNSDTYGECATTTTVIQGDGGIDEI